MKSTTQALVIAAMFATPFALHAQTSQPLTHTPAPAVDTPHASGESIPSAADTNAAGFGADPKAASQSGAGGETTISSYSPPIRTARQALFK